jgi:hypothetical protein
MIKAYTSSEHESDILFLGLGVSKSLAETHVDFLVLSGIHRNI